MRVCLAGMLGLEASRDLAEEGDGRHDRQAFGHQSSSLLWFWGKDVKQCWAFSLPLPR